ncbi:lyase family protein [Salsipaludibacter albus]|uniref:lyase family protein n=1 Tax=Salsipaludibacter albus TaxID=2849650 RepID=UPI001EE3D200|nr:3-carboxy-cis,cis-muconate cycloisomerase [Salsipaludibacter albus]
MTAVSITRDTAVAATWTARARVTRMVAAEVAWLAAGVDVGAVPPEALPGDLADHPRPVVLDDVTGLAAAIDLETVAAGLRADATPVPALLAELGPLLPDAAAPHLHDGLTSQDVVDSAAMRGLADDLATLSDLVVSSGERCAALATTHRDTAMRGRTLLQPARTTTFGLRAATWLDGLTGDRDRLRRARELVALAWGGPVGTGAGQSEERVTAWGARLDLPVAPLPWHGNRDRVHELAGLLATVAGQAASRARDLVLLSQAEVGELLDTAAGGSSAMPDKANSAAAVQSAAAARVASSAAGGLLSGTEVELERAAGAWQAEWDLLPDLVVATGAALDHGLRALEQLEVQPDAMAAHAGDDEPGRAGELVDRAVRAWQVG